jgi:zinc protease
LEQLTLDDLQKWYQAWYAPNNATIIIVGDVEADTIFQQVEAAFGDKPARPVPKRLPPREMKPIGEKRVVVKAPAKHPSLLMGFPVPSLITADNPTDSHALYMLSEVLDGGYSARISKNLIRDRQIAAGAGAGYNALSRGDTLFLFSAAPTKTTSVTTLESAIWQEIERIKQTPPTAEELNRVRAQTIASLIYAQDSLSAQASTIGQWESAGLSWRDFPTQIEKLNQVSPADIQAVAQKYLTKDRVTVGILDPQPMTSTTAKRRGPMPTRH